MADRRIFEVGQSVWCCRQSGEVFCDKLIKAGPRSFKFYLDRCSYLKDSVFHSELEARICSVSRLEASLLRYVQQLGDVSHRIDELVDD